MAELNTLIDEKILDEMVAAIRAGGLAQTDSGFTAVTTRLRATQAEQVDEKLFRYSLKDKELSRVSATLDRLQPLFYSVLFSKNCRKALDAVNSGE